MARNRLCIPHISNSSPVTFMYANPRNSKATAKNCQVVVPLATVLALSFPAFESSGNCSLRLSALRFCARPVLQYAAVTHSWLPVDVLAPSIDCFCGWSLLELHKKVLVNTKKRSLLLMLHWLNLQEKQENGVLAKFFLDHPLSICCRNC